MRQRLLLAVWPSPWKLVVVALLAMAVAWGDPVPAVLAWLIFVGAVFSRGRT